MAQVLISLGSNMGDSLKNVKDAILRLSLIDGVTLIKNSSLYRTKPWGYLKQQDFINAACVLETTLEPLALLHELLQIEQEFHRERLFKYGPRTLDLDLIAFDEITLDTPELTLPHPHMTERAFVLVPLCEIVPNYIIEPYHLSIKDLRDRLSKDALEEAQRCA